MGVGYSYGVWEQFAHHATTILGAFKNKKNVKKGDYFLKLSDLGPYFINRGGLLAGAGGYASAPET
jgi:hypothetical protein